MLSVVMLIEDKLINAFIKQKQSCSPVSKLHNITCDYNFSLYICQGQCLVCIYAYKREIDQCV